MLNYIRYYLEHLEMMQWMEILLIFAVLILVHRIVYRCYAVGEEEYNVAMLGMDVITSFILWSTLFLRSFGAVYQTNLTPFWSWYQGFILGNDEIRWQIYYNIFLFMPFGFFLYFCNMKSLRKVLFIGFLFSLFIEVSQYIFCLGLFEWDDMLHNSLGCLIGGFTSKTIERVWNLHRLHKKLGRK